MEKEKILTTNYINIVGTLVECNLKEEISKNTGKGFIKGDVKIQSVIDGEPNEFSVDFFTMETTKEGKVSQLYTSYAKLKDWLDKRVEITGSITEERFFSKLTGQMVSLQKLSGRFVRLAGETTADKAIFDFGGFVFKPLVQKLNKQNEVYAYEIEVAQADYTEENMNVFKFQIEPDKYEIIKAVEKYYTLNSSVKFWGNIRFTVSSVTVTEKASFGEDKVKTYTNVLRNFFITSGDDPITDTTAYTGEKILSLKSAYAAADVEKVAKAQTEVESKQTAVGNAPISSRQGRLI